MGTNEQERGDLSFLRALVKAIPAFVTRVDANNIVRAINLVERGVLPAGVLGEDVFTFIEPSFHEAARACFEEVRATGEPASYTSEASGPNNPLAVYENHVAPYTEDDGSVGLCIVGVDVTLERAREASLADHERWLQAAVEGTGIGLFSWGAETGQHIWNEGMYRVTGVDAPLGLDDYLRELVHPDDVAQVSAEAQEAIKTGHLRTQPHRLLTGEDQLKWVVMLGRVDADNQGLPRRLMGALLDVTDRQLLAQQRQQIERAQTVADLTGGVAHNFNNMLMAMMPTLELLSDVVPEQHRGLVDDALVAARSSTEMVRQLMITTGARNADPPAPPPAHVGAVVNSLISWSKQTFLDATPISTTACPDDLAVALSESELHQILLNLLNNAREAIEREPPPAPQIQIRVWSTDDEVKITVEDNGPGMTEETRRRAFDPFFSTKPAAGHGLGLTSAAALAGQRGGRLEVQSSPEVGTSFQLTVPRDAPPVEVPAPAAAPGPEVAWRILLVDDDYAVRRVTARVLSSKGCAVEEAASVAAATRMLEHTAPDAFDVVLLDQTMPGQPGIELVPTLRKQLPSAKVVLFTGEQVGPDVDLSLLDGSITKPVGVRVLLETLQDLLGQSGAA